MAEDQDDSQKTEEPTQKRLDDARKKGDIAKSQDVPVWFILMAGAAIIAAAQPLAGSIGGPLTMLLDHPHDFNLSNGGAHRLMSSILGMLLGPMAIVFSLIIIFAIFGHIVQHMPLWTTEKLKPKLSKISPVGGLKRMFGPQGVMNLFKAVLKLVAAVVAVGFAVWPTRHELVKVGEMDIIVLPLMLQEKASRLFIAALIVVGFIAAIDFIFQKQNHMKKMRMSREDIKQETKQTDGDPQVKAKLAALRQQRSQQRMMAAVPEATVVITNPTHYSIALKFDPEVDAAPICVAKGVDDVAMRIRELAKDADVPLVESPPLARALFATAELEQIVPREHFEAVAKVIGFVMRTGKNK